MNTIKVKTTQNVELEYEIASLGDRLLSELVDFAVYFGYMIIAGIIAGASDAAGLLIAAIAGLPILLYPLACEVFLNGRTIGKISQDIRVIKLSGKAPTLSDYLLRWIFLLIDTGISFGVVAILTIAITGKGQRLGDIIAGTSVIRNRPIRRQEYIRVRMDENYAITFPSVHLLTDRDMALIRKLFYKAMKHQNYTLLQRTAERTKEVVEIDSNLPDDIFLKTIIKDYHHLMSGVEVKS